MRILFISSMSVAPWGGSEELWSQAARRFVSRGHEVWSSHSWLSKGHPAVCTLATDGVQTCFQRPRQSKLAVLMNRLIPETSVLLNRVKPDLVVISQGGIKDGLSWMHFCALKKIPFAVIVQCNSELWFPKDRIRGTLREAYLAAEGIYCVSRHNLRLLQLQLGSDLPKARVVFNPQQLDKGDVPELSLRPNTVKMACVARMDPIAKGQDLLAQIMAMPKWQERNVQLSLYGSGSYEEGIRELFAFMGVENVRFCGQVASYREIWAENEILLMPSRYEGMSLALLESMWCRRPAVVTACGGGASEVVDDGVSGFIAPAATPELFDVAMERAWQARSEWPNMGRQARLICEERVPSDPSGAFAAALEGLLDRCGK